MRARHARLALVLFAAAPAAQDGAIVTRLGSDTLSVERFTRSATRMEGDLVRRLPGAAHWHYVIDLDGRGLPTRAELTPVHGSPAATFRIRRLTIAFEAESATVEVQRDTLARRRVAAQNAFPIFPESFGWTELWMSWLRSSRADSGAFFVVAPIGGPQGRLRARITRDSAFMTIIGGEMRMRTDARGRLLGLDGSGTTLKYTAERVRSVDVDQAYASFAARDSAQGPPGNFITRRDTSRANVGGAQLWVDYGRPGKRGRSVFERGVLGDTLWRTGANAATQLSTDKDLSFGGVRLPAGKYSLWTHIDGQTAELVVNGQSGQWGTQYDRSRDVLRLPLQRARVTGAPIEIFTIAIQPRGASEAVLKLSWDDSEFSVPFSVLP